MRRVKTTTYGQKGGDGPNTGKKATTYNVTLPDGTVVSKRDFNPPVNPVGYAYEQKVNGISLLLLKWMTKGLLVIILGVQRNRVKGILKCQ